MRPLRDCREQCVNLLEPAKDEPALRRALPEDRGARWLPGYSCDNAARAAGRHPPTKYANAAREAIQQWNRSATARWGWPPPRPAPDENQDRLQYRLRIAALRCPWRQGLATSLPNPRSRRESLPAPRSPAPAFRELPLSRPSRPVRHP